MFCPNCNTINDDNSTVCWNCGSKLAGGNSFEQSFTQTQPLESLPKKKKSKKPIVIISSIAVVVIAAIAAIIIIMGSGASKDNNSFAAAAKNVDKDSGGYAMLQGLSALDNTLFTSKSFTFSAKDMDDASVSLKIAFGNDLASTNCYGDFEDICFASYGGMAVFGEGDYGVKCNAKNIFAGYNDILDEISEKSDDYQTYIEENRTYIDRTMDIVKDNHINKDAVNALLIGSCNIFADMFGREMGVDDIEVLSDVDYDLLCNIIADVIASDPDIYDVTSNKDGSATKYEYSVNLGEFFESLRTYLLNDDSKYKVTDILSEDVINEMLQLEDEEMTLDACIDNIFSDSTLKEAEAVTISGAFTIEDKYMTSLTVYVDYDGDKEKVVSIEFTDIDSTEIEQNDYDEVESKFDELEEFETVDDVIDAMD